MFKYYLSGVLVLAVLVAILVFSWQASKHSKAALSIAQSKTNEPTTTSHGKSATSLPRNAREPGEAGEGDETDH